MIEFPVTPRKQAELQQRMQKLGVTEGDLSEKFVKSSGRGGQKVNKTSSAVVLKHLPSGIEVKYGAERSRGLNRYRARKVLCEKLEALSGGGQRAEEAEKIRRRKADRKRKARKKSGKDNAK